VARQPSFLADAMLGRLARWLRVLGVDTLYEPTLSDPELVSRAELDGRIVLTRDRALVPPKSRELPGPVRRCSRCGRIYWNGSHARRMQATLRAARPAWFP
jgi:uncharacterized protein with PIN domain